MTEPYPGGWDLDLEEHLVTGMETGRHWLTPLTQVIVRAVAVCVCVCVCVHACMRACVLTGLHKTFILNLYMLQYCVQPYGSCDCHVTLTHTCNELPLSGSDNHHT